MTDDNDLLGVRRFISKISEISGHVNAGWRLKINIKVLSCAVLQLLSQNAL